jgi:hypothetical protein
MIRTNHFSPGGNAIGREALPRLAFDKMLTKGTTSWSNGSAPKGFSISNRIRSRASQNETAASNGKLGARHRLSNDKCSCSANVHDIIGGQVSCEHAWAKSPVPSNVDPSEENNQCHAASVDAIVIASTISAVPYFGKSRAGLCAKKLTGRSSNSCHTVGITGQSSARGT